jgi:hypothetical protein
MGLLKRSLATGDPLDMEIFDVLLGPYGGESRLVRLVMANGRQYHCHFRRPEADVSLPGWPKKSLPRWDYPGDGRVSDLSLDAVTAAVDEALQKGLLDKAFAPSRSPQETWQWIIEFYAGYPDYPWHEPVRRFLPLVRRIAASPFGARFYASQSHETLVLSTHGTAPERENAPCLAIDPGDESIRVTKYRRNTESLGETSYPLAEVWPTLQPYLDWLLAAAEPCAANGQGGM